jgi:hypothetical protein
MEKTSLQFERIRPDNAIGDGMKSRLIDGEELTALHCIAGDWNTSDFRIKIQMSEVS